MVVRQSVGHFRSIIAHQFKKVTMEFTVLPQRSYEPLENRADIVNTLWGDCLCFPQAKIAYFSLKHGDRTGCNR
jgi:hypothetical protein